MTTREAQNNGQGTCFSVKLREPGSCPSSATEQDAVSLTWFPRCNGGYNLISLIQLFED